MSITSTSRVKAILGLAAGVTFHDTAVGAAVDGANAHVLRKLGQASLAVTTTSEYPDVYGEGQDTILLRHAPVAGLGVVTNHECAVSTSDYVLDDEVGKITLRGTAMWSTERLSTCVQYGWGYTSATVPADVVRATELIAVASFNKGPMGGVSTKSSSGYQIVLRDEDIPAEARALLAYYEDRHRP